MQRFQKRCSFHSIIKHMVSYSTASTINSDSKHLLDIPHLSNDEHQKILITLNKSNLDEELSRFLIPKGRIKKLEVWKNIKGGFKSIDDLLEVEGFDVKGIKRLCDCILTNEPIAKKKKLTYNSRFKQFLSPPLSLETSQNIQTAVGLQLDSTGVSWARILRSNNELDVWSYNNFTDLPPKMAITDTFKLAVDILDQIPVADIYVFESTNTSHQQQNSLASVSAQMQKLELGSMLLALINTNARHNTSVQNEEKIDCTSVKNSVYYLKSKLPARLFKTLVGNEKVSTLTTITQILDGSLHILPYTPIRLNQQLRNEYDQQSSVSKELMGQALMLVITFLDLCVYKNLCSISAILSKKST